jgi:hypothetical protein
MTRRDEQEIKRDKMVEAYGIGLEGLSKTMRTLTHYSQSYNALC